MVRKILKRLKTFMIVPQSKKRNSLLKMKSCDRNKKERRSGGTFSVNPKITLKGWIVYAVFSLCWQLSDYCVYCGAPWFIGEWFLSTVWIRSYDRHRVVNSESSSLYFTLVRNATFRLSCDKSGVEHNTFPTRPPGFFTNDPKRRSLIYQYFSDQT